MFIQVDGLFMAAKRIHILKYLVYELTQKLNILSEDGIMKRLGVMEINKRRFYIKKHCDTYIKAALHIHIQTNPEKKGTNLDETLHTDIIK